MINKQEVLTHIDALNEVLIRSDRREMHLSTKDYEAIRTVTVWLEWIVYRGLLVNERKSRLNEPLTKEETL